METIRSYFALNKDYNEMVNVFSMLYKRLEVIHENGMYVPVISSDHILYEDGTFVFDDMRLADNIELRKRENLVALSKLFLGTFLSLSTDFKDFSMIDTDWFTSNMNSINSSIVADQFYPEYFESVFIEGNNEYFDDFYEKQLKKEELNSRSNNKTYKKILNNAASGLYSDYFEEEVVDENVVEKKSAYINFLFYPTLIICGAIIVFVFYTCFNIFS